VIRFLHTADIQLVGLGRADDTEIARRRRERFETLRRIVALAREQEVDFIAICGDLFEDNYVSPQAVHEALSILREADPIPVFILPGNHDPYCPGSVYHRSAFEAAGPVRVLGTPEPVMIGEDCVIYPCPLTQKSSLQDPTGVIPLRESDDVIRIGLAHGALQIPGLHEEHDHPIPPEAPVTRGLEYLALGHWHSLLIGDSHRWAYPGTPEQTAFDDKRAGKVLLVSIAGPGAVPQLEEHEVGGLTWLEWERPVSEPAAEALARLRGEIEQLPSREDTLLRLHLTGAVRADSLPLLADFADWLEHVGLLRADVDNQVRTTESLEGALRQIVDSDPVIAGAAADLRWLASLETGASGLPEADVPPRASEELLGVWQAMRTETQRDVEDAVDMPTAAEIADEALMVLAQLAGEVQS
jgi:DNA repair exonuclease SbcCD nuclease subunit